MSEDMEQYQYFTVGLLKNSFALEALKADALKYHMIEQPDKLIALRLTEYYELLARVTPTHLEMPHPTASSADVEVSFRESLPVEREAQPAYRVVNEIIAASPDADQNADEAADYWAKL
ncbi:MAG: hypothetical protein JO202_08475 [Ktedonobacteraceae bacterium]|nr:hypothetical protein [Ktedonobacteraceae bacterium]